MSDNYLRLGGKGSNVGVKGKYEFETINLNSSTLVLVSDQDDGTGTWIVSDSLILYDSGITASVQVFTFFEFYIIL